jgi:ABC-2 type transport system ATP-binding protein
MNAVLQTHSLTKRYGSLAAVADLSLEVNEGEVFGLLGPNGAGKTTSINMMCGLLRPDAGHVTIRGKPIVDGGADVRTRVGVCPQNIVLWGQLTCLEQMVFIGEMYGIGRRVARQRGEQLLKELDLTGKRNSRARTLSGGMQRRLNLAMALVHDPEILVLDEPEAGLDPQSRVLVREYVKSLARRKTIILTTHNMDEAERMADRVAIIDRGKLLTLDTPEALKRTVGEGDVLEIETSEDFALSEVEGGVQIALEAVAKIAPQVSSTNHTLVVRARGVVEFLPAILDALRSVNVHPAEVRLRANTLEDVFISLTGRRLRE